METISIVRDRNVSFRHKTKQESIKSCSSKCKDLGSCPQISIALKFPVFMCDFISFSPYADKPHFQPHHYPSVNIQRYHNTKSESNVKCGLWVIRRPCTFIIYNKSTTLMGDVDREAVLG